MITDEYRAGWRAACAHLHDLFEEAAGFYGNAPGRAAITGTYRRAAAVALGEAEDPQVGLSAVGGPVKPSGPLTAEEATPDCVVLDPRAPLNRDLLDRIEIISHSGVDDREGWAEAVIRKKPARRQHDPGALMEEPDQFQQGEGDDRG